MCSGWLFGAVAGFDFGVGYTCIVVCYDNGHVCFLAVVSRSVNSLSFIFPYRFLVPAPPPLCVSVFMLFCFNFWVAAKAVAFAWWGSFNSAGRVY